MRIINSIMAMFSFTNIIRPINGLQIPYNKYTNIYSSNNIINNNNCNSFNQKAKQSIIINNKKLITISPGGLQAFYMIGICKYIKQNYRIDNSYAFAGASAGAWNSLFMSFKGNDDKFIEALFSINFIGIKSINDIQLKIKDIILNDYRSTDFNLKNLYIPVSILRYNGMYPMIYNDFSDIEDALDCCITSSHIPFVTGGLVRRYNNIISFDGGIIKNPYPSNFTPIIKITPNMWRNRNNDLNYFDKSKLDIKSLFIEGYNDAKDNKSYLDKIFN